MTVSITGATGFIGRRLVQRLHSGFVHSSSLLFKYEKIKVMRMQCHSFLWNRNLYFVHVLIVYQFVKLYIFLWALLEIFEIPCILTCGGYVVFLTCISWKLAIGIGSVVQLPQLEKNLELICYCAEVLLVFDFSVCFPFHFSSIIFSPQVQFLGRRHISSFSYCIKTKFCYIWWECLILSFYALY